MKNTFLCNVEKDETDIRFFPAKNASRRPLVPEGELHISIKPDAPPAETGEALRTAFSSLQPRGKKSGPGKSGR